MMKNLFKAIMVVLFCSSAFAFDSFEHLWIGDSISLTFPEGVDQSYRDYPYRQVENVILLSLISKDILITKPTPSYLMLTSPNNSAEPIKVSFGEIVALAGDFIGKPDGTTISEPHQDQVSLQQRFRDALGYLWPYKGNPYYANNNLPFLQVLFEKELGTLQKVINEQGGIHRNLARSHTVLAKIWANVASDYGKSPYYIKLLSNNIDHFQPDGIQAYMAGHADALETAKLAYRSKSDPTESLRLLNLAYATDAFSCHFLTDAFSAGHVRTPRRELLNIQNITSVDSGLLSNAMHDEDAWVGLEVVNATGREWTAYGDSSYFDYKSLTSRSMIKAALQASVDEVWQAANTGEAPEFGKYRANEYIPFALPTQTFNPLVRKGENGYEVRKDVSDYHSSKYELLTHTSGVFAFLRNSKNSYNKLSFYDYVSSDQAAYDGKYEIEVDCFTNFERNRFFGNKDYVVLPDRVDAYYIDNAKKGFQNLKGHLKPDSKFYVVSLDEGRDLLEYCLAATEGSTLVEIRARSSKITERNGLPVVLYDIYGDLYRVLGHGDAYFVESEIKEDIKRKLENRTR